MKAEKLTKKRNRKQNDLRFYNSVRKAIENVTEQFSTEQSTKYRKKYRHNLGGGRYLNFRIISKYDDGTSAVIFTDKKGANRAQKRFRENCIFVDLDSNGVSRKQISLVINLKNNPDVVIFKSTRNEIRAEILK